MATAGLSLPSVGAFEPGTDFDAWLKGVQIYLTALGITAETRRTAVLLHLVGPDLQAVYETLPEPEGVTGEFDVCAVKLKAHLCPARSAVADRVAFQRLKMDASEGFDHYLGRLRQAAARCGFAQPEDAIRDQLIAGCTPRLQERILQRAAERDVVSLQDVINLAHTAEKTERLLREVRQTWAPVEPVHVVQQQRPGARRRSQGPGREGSCFICGKAGHWRRDCPDQQTRSGRETCSESTRPRSGGPRCYRCGQQGHFKRDCRQKPKSEAVREVNGQGGAADAYPEMLHIKTGGAGDTEPPTVDLLVNGQPMRFVVDTGSPVTIVGVHAQVPGLQLQRSARRLSGFTGHVIPVKGEALVHVQYQDLVVENLTLLVTNLPRAINL